MSFTPESQETPASEPRVSAATYSSDERMWAMLAHLSGPITVWLGGMGFIGPLIVWLVKKESSAFVDEQGKESLNFQINLLGQALIGGFVGLILFVVTLGLAIFLIIPVLVLWSLYALIMPILAGVSANSGASYRYPLTIRVIK